MTFSKIPHKYLVINYRLVSTKLESKKCIHSSVFLCSSAPIFIFQNMFLYLKTDVCNLCTSARKAVRGT
jgi:hypothetical protein